MKAEVMAQFLTKGDTLRLDRKKYEVVNGKTVDRDTTLLIKGVSTGISSIHRVPCDKFFRVTNNNRFLDGKGSRND